MKNTFSKLCLPTEKKIAAIQDMVKKMDLKSEFVEGQGLIVNRQDKPKFVIVSHYDLIPLFNKGFKKRRMPLFNDGMVIGGLDNTITNTVLLHAMKHLKNSGAIENIEIVFTDMEEVGLVGMKNYLESNGKRLKDSFFINLDVTNEFYIDAMNSSIEYDKPNSKILERLEFMIDENEFRWGITQERFEDDLDMVVQKGFHGFSYCLPTGGNIHSYHNVCLEKMFDPYLEGLIYIIENLEFSKEDLVCDIVKEKEADLLELY